MKNMKKVLIAAFACIVVCGISVPVIAANMRKTNVRVENEVNTRDTKLGSSLADTSMTRTDNISAESLSNTAAVIADDAPAEIAGPARETAESADITSVEAASTGAYAACAYYVDANGDGICDHCAHNETGDCGHYTDVNGDGICDYCAHNASGSCGNYVDANGDGICDHCAHNETGNCGHYVDADWDGICDYCTHRGGGNCGSYADANGDGVCDNCTGGSTQGSGSHHGSHHGGRHH